MSAVRPTVSFSSMNFNEKPHTRRILVAARRRPKLRSFGLTARVDHRRTFCGLCKFVTRFLTTANWYDSKSIARYCAPFPSLSPATGIVRAIPISKLKRPMFRVRNVSLAKTSFPFFIFFSFFFPIVRVRIVSSLRGQFVVACHEIITTSSSVTTNNTSTG